MYCSQALYPWQSPLCLAEQVVSWCWDQSQSTLVVFVNSQKGKPRLVEKCERYGPILFLSSIFYRCKLVWRGEGWIFESMVRFQCCEQLQNSLPQLNKWVNLTLNSFVKVLTLVNCRIKIILFPNHLYQQLQDTQRLFSDLNQYFPDSIYPSFSAIKSGACGHTR